MKKIKIIWVFVFAINLAYSANNTIEEELSISVRDCTLYGTLVIPEDSEHPVPLFFLIAGSGPTDRDGNSTLLPGKNNSYKMLAEELQKKGIASFRYDKRGVGKSKFEISDYKIVFRDYLQDIIDLINMLSEDDRFSEIILAGHSKGSLLGMLAFGEVEAEAFISIAGSGRRIDEVIFDQSKEQLSVLPGGEALLDTIKTYFNLLKNEQTFNYVHPYLLSIFHPVNQGFMIDWLRYDPSEEIAKIEAPILIIQGTNDIQIKEEEARILSKANPSANLVFIEGMNHILKMADIDDIGAYSNPDLEISDNLIKEIRNFIISL